MSAAVAPPIAARVRRVLTRALVALAAALLVAPATPVAHAATPLLGGYFIYASSSPSQTRAMLDDITSAGARTVITFGTRLRPATVTGGRPAVDGFAECTVNGTGCVTAVAAGRPVRAVYTYTESGTWHPGLLRCGDSPVSAAGKQYTVFLFPTSGGGCTGSAYDAVVTLDASTPTASKTANLLTAAADRGMSVYLGMPAPVARTSGATWLPDTSYLGTLEQFTDRWLTNLDGYTGANALAGLYHHTEMPLSSSTSWQPVLDVYATQARLVARILPGKATLVSPYMDARRSSGSATPLDQVPAAVRRIAATASGTSLIIAPQDGQGTGKVGAYTPAMAADPVEAPSAAVAGSGSYAQRYLGSTGDYVRQVVAGAAGRARVWVNAELMAATTTGAPVCDGASNGRGKADIDRVRRQVGVASVPGVEAVIGFMWTPYVTCGGQASLLTALRTFPSPTHQSAGGAGSTSPAQSRTGAHAPKTVTAPDPVVLEVQRALAELGYTDVGPADGIAGPATAAAVTAFQTDAGHPVTGAADSSTAQQLRTAVSSGWQRPVTRQTPAPPVPAPAATANPAAPYRQAPPAPASRPTATPAPAGSPRDEPVLPPHAPRSHGPLALLVLTAAGAAAGAGSWAVRRRLTGHR